jgi:hypothetical protein
MFRQFFLISSLPLAHSCISSCTTVMAVITGISTWKIREAKRTGLRDR